MEARIVEFAEVLRQNGLKVARLRDARTRCAPRRWWGSTTGRPSARCSRRPSASARATWRPSTRAFDFYFSGAARTFEAIDRSLADRIEEEGLLEGDELAMLICLAAAGGRGALAADPAALEGDRAALAQLFRRRPLQLDFSRMQSTCRRASTAAGCWWARACETDAAAT